MPLILESFFQPIVFLYVFHGDCYSRCHISWTRPYYSYGFRIFIHSSSDSSSKRNRGNFCLSHVTVVLIIDLWWSENSTSCQFILTEIQNSALFTIVLTEGKYIDDVQDPISKIRLEEIIPCCWFYCSGSDFDCMALFNLLDIGIYQFTH